MKTYSAASGFVYQYQFTAHEGAADGELYRFATTLHRGSAFDVVVMLPHAPLAEWEKEQRRALTPTERYAVAKMALFAAYDDAEAPGQLPNPITVDAGQVRAIAETLDL